MGAAVTWVKRSPPAGGFDYLFRAGAYADRGPTEPRLILLDLKMPRVDGIEVLKAIKGHEETRRIPTVVMTSSQEESDVVQSYDLGANSYLVKPISFESLSGVAGQAGLYWLSMNRGAPLTEMPHFPPQPHKCRMSMPPTTTRTRHAQGRCLPRVLQVEDRPPSTPS